MFDTNGVERCDEFCTHGEIIGAVRPEMPEEEKLYDLAELFKIFGDTTRIRILYVLFEAEMCVCDIAEVLQMTQSAISHQLRLLKQAKLVRSRRRERQSIMRWRTIMCARSSDRAWNILRNESQGRNSNEKGVQDD